MLTGFTLQIFVFLVLASFVLSEISQHAQKHHHHHRHHHHKRHRMHNHPDRYHRPRNSVSSYYRSPKSRVEEQFLTKCNTFCKCFRISETTTENDFHVQCTSIKNLWSLAQSQEMEGISLSLEVSDDNIQKINGNCAIEVMDATKACFSTEKIFPLFKSVHKLTLRGFSNLTNLGNEESDYFTLMPNLKTLTLNLDADHVVNIYFSYSTQNLRSLEIVLSPEEVLRIRCHNKVCMPSTMQKLHIIYNNGSQLQFIDSQRFSKALNEVTMESSGSSQYVKFLSGSKIQNLKLKLKSYDDFALSLKDVRITRRFVVDISASSNKNQHYKQLNEIYQNQKLKQLAEFQYTDNQFNSFPAIIGSSRTTFKRTFFGTCRLSRNILANSKQTISIADDGSKRLALRDWYIDLKSINELFQRFDEIIVTAYYVDISESFNIPDDKRLVVYYFQIGATSKIANIYKSVFVNVTSNTIFHVKDLNARAVSYQFSTASDAIFIRALALCIVKNAGAFVKRKSGSNSLFDIESKEFWAISKQIPNNITFGSEYTSAEESLAWEALANMNKYLRMVVRQNTQMKELSYVTLQPLNEGEYVLSRYGKKILENENTDFNAESLAQLKKLSKTQKWISLDHLYHMIVTNKERVNNAFDSHVNGRPLLYKLVTMFNEYKKQVDDNQELFERVSKRTNSFRNTKTITVIVQSLALLFEDKRAFEHSIKNLDDVWKPLKTQTVVDSLKDIRTLMLTLDDMSINFGKLKSKIESKQQQFLKYVDSIFKLIDFILSPMKTASLADAEKRNVKKLLEIQSKLEVMKQELLWPEQIVKTLNLISKAIEIGKTLPKKQRTIFNKIPDPLSYFSANEVYTLFRKGLTVKVDVCQGWSEVKTWLRNVLNSTTVNHMFQKLNVRYPIINLVNTADEITQEMVSNFGYQMSIIESYMSYIVGYNKAFKLHQSYQEPEKALPNTNKTSLVKTKQINDIKTHIENEKISLKLDLLHNINLWCDAYFYKNLRECPLDFRDTGMGDSLVDLLSAYQFLVNHNDALGRIKQPEASFVHEFNFTLPSYCKCFTSKGQQPHSVLADGYDSGYMNDFACAQRTIKSTENRDTGSLDDLLDIANTCFDNKIKQLHNFNTFSFKIDSKDEDFNDKIDVMISRIDVFLHGARTTTHEVKVYVANTGIYELKTNKDVRVIYEDTLLQELLYDISSNQSLLIGKPTTRSDVSSMSGIKSELSEFEETVNELKNTILNAPVDDSLGNSPRENFYVKNNWVSDADIDTGGWASETMEPKYKTRLNKSLFSNWIVMVPPDKNPGLDTHSVKKITVKISGTFRSFIKKSAFFL